MKLIYLVETKLWFIRRTPRLPEELCCQSLIFSWQLFCSWSEVNFFSPRVPNLIQFHISLLSHVVRGWRCLERLKLTADWIQSILINIHSGRYWPCASLGRNWAASSSVWTQELRRSQMDCQISSWSYQRFYPAQTHSSLKHDIRSYTSSGFGKRHM